ncbi:MAG: sugar phosphate isomerase/epimerase [Planctomycetota bacterium]|nr:sugar phosphate isomerase/epimerase [Planctomycetota bacterium]
MSQNTMKFAFSTIACPTGSFETIVAKAKSFAYDGVEIRGQLHEKPLTAADIFQSDPADIRSLFSAANLQIACLSSSISLTGHRKADPQAAADLRQYIDTAQNLACPLVRILGTRVQGGQSLTESAAALGRWLLPLAHYAADHQVTLAIENVFPFSRASEIWMVLEALHHPALAVCWNLLWAAQAGEQPAISIPVLNSRIRCVRVTDATFDPTTTYCKLGQGALPIQKLLARLQGIGYAGWISYDWPKALFTQLADPDEILPDAITQLRDWTKPSAKPQKAKPAPPKPAPVPAAP